MIYARKLKSYQRAKRKRASLKLRGSESLEIGIMLYMYIADQARVRLSGEHAHASVPQPCFIWRMLR